MLLLIIFWLFPLFSIFYHSSFIYFQNYTEDGLWQKRSYNLMVDIYQIKMLKYIFRSLAVLIDFLKQEIRIYLLNKQMNYIL